MTRSIAAVLMLVAIAAAAHAQQRRTVRWTHPDPAQVGAWAVTGVERCNAAPTATCAGGVYHFDTYIEDFEPSYIWACREETCPVANCSRSNGLWWMPDGSTRTNECGTMDFTNDGVVGAPDFGSLLPHVSLSLFTRFVACWGAQ